LERSLVEVNHNSQTRHKEEEECDPEALYALFTGEGLIKQSDQSQQKWQQIIGITTLVVGHFIGQIRLITHQHVVNKANAGDPVTVVDFPVSLQIILATGKIPHEIAPVHEIHLVADEEAQVLNHGRFHDCFLTATTVDDNALTLEIAPLLIGFHMIFPFAVHAWEKHIGGRFHHRSLFVASDDVLVRLIRIFLGHLIPQSMLFLVNRHTIAALRFPTDVGGKGFPVQ